MKQHMSVIFTLVVLFVSINSSYAESCILKARVTIIPPLYFQTDSNQWTGLTVDLTNVLLNEAGCKAEYEEVSWARSLDLMKKGKIDMMMNLSKTNERDNFIHFIGPHNIETAQLMVRKAVTTDIQSLDDFKKLPGEIGFQKGSFYGMAFHEKLKNDPEFKSKFEVSFSHGNNIRKLGSGRIIGILGQSYSGVSAEQYLHKTGRFKIHPFIINQNKVYFGFSKKSVSADILARLEAAYKRADAKKDFQRVIDSYK